MSQTFPVEPSNVTFTYEQASEFAKVTLHGDYLLGSYLTRERLSAYRKQGFHTLVDFGCGPGNSTKPLTPLLQPGGRLVGVDVSEDMLAEARKLNAGFCVPEETTTPANSPGTLEYLRILSDSQGRETIPLDGGSVDAVASRVVLQELQTEAQLRNAFSEIHRILRRGGAFVSICVNDRITDQDFISMSYKPFPENQTRQDGLRKCLSTATALIWEKDRHWSQEFLDAALHDAGFSHVHFERPLPPPGLVPFPSQPDVSWKDESFFPPFLVFTAT